ncbi:MAG: hypothetical protein ACT4P4_07710 [Betaproteobacteria bacterium]
MNVLSKEKSQVLAERNGWSMDYSRGYVDGEMNRRRGHGPTAYVLVGIDDYCLGFRAGYFDRAAARPAARPAARLAEASAPGGLRRLASVE